MLESSHLFSPEKNDHICFHDRNINITLFVIVLSERTFVFPELKLTWMQTIFIGWGYTHDCCADKYHYQHNRRADKDSYPRDRNVTDDLCSLIKHCFAYIIVNFST